MLIMRKNERPDLPPYISQALGRMSGVTNVKWDSGNIHAEVDGEKIVTNAGQVDLMDDDALKRQDLTWNFSKKNKLSPHGRVIGPIYEAEMVKRKLRPVVNSSEDSKDPENTMNTLSRILRGTIK
jgi:hypothetical protein